MRGSTWVVALLLGPAMAGAAAATLVATLAACASTMEQTEGVSLAGVPPEQQADYRVFAQRCSKCHSLARPLNSGITDDEYWRLYVAKMRRQPASGISEADTVPILRFLHWYSVERGKPKPDGGVDQAPPPPDHAAKTIETPQPARPPEHATDRSQGAEKNVDRSDKGDGG